jgi:hypothetical protein
MENFKKAQRKPIAPYIKSLNLRLYRFMVLPAIIFWVVLFCNAVDIIVLSYSILLVDYYFLLLFYIILPILPLRPSFRQIVKIVGKGTGEHYIFWLGERIAKRREGVLAYFAVFYVFSTSISMILIHLKTNGYSLGF